MQINSVGIQQRYGLVSTASHSAEWINLEKGYRAAELAAETCSLIKVETAMIILIDFIFKV